MFYVVVWYLCPFAGGVAGGREAVIPYEYTQQYEPSHEKPKYWLHFRL